MAQGLNLPASLAILAGDRRHDDEEGRVNLEAHEILNAAARAGRAGHLANGVVLLIPEPLIEFRRGSSLALDVVNKLKAILPEDDRCVEIIDPLENVLDRIMVGDSTNPDVAYVINRMIAMREADEPLEATNTFDLSRSYGAFLARQKSQEEEFKQKLTALQAVIAQSAPDLNRAVQGCNSCIGTKPAHSDVKGSRSESGFDGKEDKSSLMEANQGILPSTGRTFPVTVCRTAVRFSSRRIGERRDIAPTAL